LLDPDGMIAMFKLRTLRRSSSPAHTIPEQYSFNNFRKACWKYRHSSAQCLAERGLASFQSLVVRFSGP
jgi:hypothetical protein